MTTTTKTKRPKAEEKLMGADQSPLTPPPPPPRRRAAPDTRPAVPSIGSRPPASARRPSLPPSHRHRPVEARRTESALPMTAAASVSSRRRTDSRPGVPMADLPAISARFEWGALLGQGGMGRVMSAIDGRLRREVALKILATAGGERAAWRFLDEAQITAQLQHPNIIPIYDIIDGSDGQPIISMKPIAGETFAAVIREAHRTAGPAGITTHLRRLLDIFSKVCDAVAFAHSKGIIHRDLKPHNIMVGEFGDVVVMDWGLAKPIGYTPSDDPIEPIEERVTSDRREQGVALTMQGTVQGTPAYMAPEQAMGGNRLDEGTDIYALGGILYTILTNALPIDAANVSDELQAVIEHNFSPPRQRAPHAKIPAELEAVTLRAMSRRRRDRFANVGELQAEIARYWDGQLLVSARYGVGQRIAKWVRRHPTFAISATVSILFVALLGVAMSAFFAQAERAAAAEEKEAAAREIAAAAARVASAEAARRAEAEARQLDAEKVARDRQQILDAMQAGNYEHVLNLLSGQIQGSRDAVVEEFIARYKRYIADKKTDAEFIASLGEKKLTEYIAAFDRLFEAHEKWGVAVTAMDYLYRATLNGMGGRDVAGALADLDRALTMNPSSADASLLHSNRGYIRRINGDFRGAIADYDVAIAIEPNSIEAYLNRGLLKLDTGDFAGAVRDLDVVIRLDGITAGHFVSRGNAHFSAGNFDAAFRDYSTAIHLEPSYAPSYINRGQISTLREDFAAALADFDTGIRLAPDDGAAYWFRGSARARMRQFDIALNDLDTAVSLLPNNPEIYLARGEIHRVRGQLGSAIADFDTVLRLDPTSAAALVLRGITRMGMSHYPAAVADFDAAIRLDGRNWRAWANRGSALMHSNQAAALESLQTAYRFCDDPAVRPQLRENIRRHGGTVPDAHE